MKRRLPILLFFTGWLCCLDALAQRETLFTEKLSGLAKRTAQDWMAFKEGAGNYDAAFFERNKAAFELTPFDEMRLVKTDTDVETGLTHYFHQQYYKGYKVLQGQLNVHTKGAQLYKANGQVARNNNREVRIVLSKSEAENISARLFGGEARWFSSPTELVWAPAGNDPSDVSPGNLVLAYQVSVKSNAPLRGEAYFIDAATGKLVSQVPTVYSCQGTTTGTVWYGNNTIYTTKNAQNTYELQDACGSTVIEVLQGVYTNPDKFISNNNTWAGQENGTTALHVAKRTVQYFLDVHGRKSWDNADHRVTFVIDRANCTSFCRGNNASASDTMWFGNSLTAALEDDWYTLDIFGHEFTHNVTQSAVVGGLVYQGESGALNESFSDIFGNAVDLYNGGAGGAGGNAWLTGEDRRNAASNSLWLRDMRNPNNANPNTSQSTPQPKKYNGLYYVPTTGCTPNGLNDLCGVHTNSGVQNYMFYLLTEGGSGSNEGITFSVSGIGIVKSRRIAYKTLTGGYLTANARFSNARDAWVQAAQDLYGECSEEAFQTAKAWYSVGVGSANYATQVCGFVNLTYDDVFRFGGAQELTAGGSCNTEIISVSNNANTATFSSSKAVVLKPGFLAPAGKNFKAVISACSLAVY